MGTRIVGDHAYSYRSIRQGDRVTTVYLGTGPVGRSFADRLAEDRARCRAGRRADEERSRPLIEWSGRVDGLVRRALEAAGYHRHERGEWRRRRGMATKRDQKPGAVPAAQPEATRRRDVMDRWDGRAGMSEAEAMAAVREDPIFAATIGDPAKVLRSQLLMRFAGANDQLTLQAATLRLEEVERNLAGPEPTALERLLAERAALCWLDLYIYQQGVGRKRDGVTIAQAAHEQRRIDAAHRRFLSAVKALATVRKLAIPNLLVNVDGRSVHFGSPPPEAPQAVPGPTIHVPTD